MYLGEFVEPASHSRTGSPVNIDPSELVTHGVIVGQTGSGKTGLGIGLVEEALRSGVPCLLIDPKGDLTNLCLTFTGLSAAEFAPWVEDGDAATASQSWATGLASFGLAGTDIAALRKASTFTVYTPGAATGTALNLIGSLKRPPISQGDAGFEEIETLASALLSLVGIESDPLSGREHILVANLISNSWKSGNDLDLAALVAQIQSPPLRKLGVIDIESFYPTKDRTDLALKFNGLLASPSFAAWSQGVDIDIDSLLHDGEMPRCAIISVAHLDDEQRQFAVAVVLGRLIAWMRRQSGTTKLRALVYFDEVFGFVPPTAMPPTKKPILTLLKQARAFGVGCVLATQNPVDLDYKAISNAGTWIIGRLQTERDKQRLLDGMQSAAGAVAPNLDATISGLAKREFVLHRAGRSGDGVFTTRWTMSYLRGPLTGQQIAELYTLGLATAGSAKSGASASGPTTGLIEPGTDDSKAIPMGHDEVPIPPQAAPSVAVRYMHPSAPWASLVGAKPGSPRYAPYLVARLQLLFDDKSAALHELDEWEALFDLTVRFAPEQAIPIDIDDRDFVDSANDAKSFVLSKVAISEPALFSGVTKMLTDYLVANKTISIWQNEAMKLWSRPHESEQDFINRCDLAGQQMADVETEKLRASLEAKIDKVKAAIEEAQRRQDLAEHEAHTSRTTEIVRGAGDLIGSLLGGRSTARSISRSVGAAIARHGRSSDKAARAESTQDSITTRQSQLDELEAELGQQVTEIDQRYEALAKAVNSQQVPLERSDVRVVELSLAWIPK